MRTAKILLNEPEPFPINWQDLGGNTFLHFAATSGTVETACMLIEAGADRTIKNKCGLLPVHLAAAPGKRRMLKFLGQIRVEGGISPYSPDGIDLRYFLYRPAGDDMR